MAQSDSLAFLKYFARLAPADQEAVAQHLSRTEQAQLADWLETASPQALKVKARTLRARLAGNSAAFRTLVHRAVARRRLTQAALASLDAHLPGQPPGAASASPGATGRDKVATR